MLRSHRDLILNWFRAKGQFASGIVEGFNGKARVITKRAYGFAPARRWKSLCIMHLAIYRNLSIPTDSADEAGDRPGANAVGVGRFGP